LREVQKLKRAVARFESSGKGAGNKKMRKGDSADGPSLSSVKVMPPAHVHSFPASSEVLVNEADGLWQKSCVECGFTVEFEKL
jgi:NAD-dependent dihydropyrimidine dehydrogenase PreA subunit